MHWKNHSLRNCGKYENTFTHKIDKTKWNLYWITANWVEEVCVCHIFSLSLPIFSHSTSNAFQFSIMSCYDVIFFHDVSSAIEVEKFKTNSVENVHSLLIEPTTNYTSSLKANREHFFLWYFIRLYSFLCHRMLLFTQLYFVHYGRLAAKRVNIEVMGMEKETWTSINAVELREN